MQPRPRFAFIPPRMPLQILHSSEILRNLTQVSAKNYDASKQTHFRLSEVSMETIGHLFMDHKVIMVR